MAGPKKHGKKKEGNAAKFTTRNKALNRLQIKLPEFRRLCILKGIHPREPRKKFEGQNKTYYHVKDINFLAHEPLLEKSRQITAFNKKIKKAKAKKNKALAARLERNKPIFSLDHLVKERYPSFIDALRDLDDPLTTIHLFATLPADNVHGIPAELVQSCRRLSLEWQAYIAHTHSLRKTFVSVKGIYYQAVVFGQTITWLTPHALQQVLPEDVDFRVMLTFSEFYQTLMGFVNFKLYHSLGLKYPPKLDSELEIVTTEAIEKKEEEEEDEETRTCKTLFANLKFFLGREVPRDALHFVITSFGGTVSWDGAGAPFQEIDEDITHQIVDRTTPGHTFLSRDYIQPQWVFDCVNHQILLPTIDYIPGRVPPPHLSPFVDNEKEGYSPEYAQSIKRLQATSQKKVLPLPEIENNEFGNSHQIHAAAAARYNEATEAASKEIEIMTVEKCFKEDLEKELAGISFSASLQSTKQLQPKHEGFTRLVPEKDVQVVSEKDVQAVAENDDDAAQTNLAKMMMSCKTRKLYDAMQMGNARKRARLEQIKLRKKQLPEPNHAFIQDF